MRNRKLILLLVLVAVAGLLIWQYGDALNLQTIRANQERLIAWRDNNYFAAALIFIAIYATVVFFSVPVGLYMTLIGGFLFGTWIGGTLIVFAATLGSALLFIAAKWLAGESVEAWIKERAGNAVRRMRAGVEENAASYLLISRLVPVFPFWLMNLLPAFLGVPFKTFVWTTFVGIIPGTFVYASVGSGLGDILAAGGTPDLGIIFSPTVLVPLLGLAALSALPIFLKKKGAQP